MCIRDRCIEGAAVTSLAVRFVLDWNYAAKENLFLEDRLFEIPNYVRHGRDPVSYTHLGLYPRQGFRGG